eukprot:4025851-Prorocentrum_lima.AAC.1
MGGPRLRQGHGRVYASCIVAGQHSRSGPHEHRDGQHGARTLGATSCHGFATATAPAAARRASLPPLGGLEAFTRALVAAPRTAAASASGMR